MCQELLQVVMLTDQILTQAFAENSLFENELVLRERLTISLLLKIKIYLQSTIVNCNAGIL